MNKINAEIKKNSITKVFDCVCLHGSVSRNEIQDLTGLSWGTVSGACAELTDKQLLTCRKGNSHGRGRVSEVISVNAQNNLCLGIDINATGITIVVCDLAGNRIDDLHCELASYDADDVINLTVSRAKQFMDKYPSVWNVSISMQGQINARSGVSLRAERFNNWHNVPLTELLQKQLGVPVYLYHDPDCLMSYHKRVDKLIGDENNVAIIRLDDGVGMSLLINGKSVESDCVVAEIGHVCVVPDGLSCSCGKQGCLESYVSLCALAKEYAVKHGYKISVKEFVRLLNDGDGGALELLRKRMRYLGIALANLSNLINLQKVIISGTLGNSANLFVDVVEDTFMRNTVNPCVFVTTEFAAMQPAIGACLKTVLRFKDALLFD